MAFKDAVKTVEQLDAALDTNAAPPNNPCPKCRAEMKEHHPTKQGKLIIARSKICSSKACRFVAKVDVETGLPIQMH